MNAILHRPRSADSAQGCLEMTQLNLFTFGFLSVVFHIKYKKEHSRAICTRLPEDDATLWTQEAGR